MPTILIAGTQNQPFGSFSQVSQSQDGLTWNAATAPFAQGDFCTGIASDGVLSIISNQRGYLAATTDFITYSSVEINDGFGTTAIGYQDSTWLATGSYNYIDGFGPYPPKTQVAQIYRSPSGNTDWQMVWTHPDDGSLFYQIQFFPDVPINSSLNADVWVVVGDNGKGVGNVWYSLDSGMSWTQADVPAHVGIIYSVSVYNLGGVPTWYWGCRGKIFLSANLHTANWNELPLAANDTAIGFTQNNTGELVVNGCYTLYTSLDGLVFTTFNAPGYVWSSVAVLELTTGSRWLAFARSNLTQWTYWYSDDLKTWTPESNSITVQAYTIL